MDDAGGTHTLPEKWATGGLVKVVGRDGRCRRDACGPRRFDHNTKKSRLCIIQNTSVFKRPSVSQGIQLTAKRALFWERMRLACTFSH